MDRRVQQLLEADESLDRDTPGARVYHERPRVYHERPRPSAAAIANLEALQRNRPLAPPKKVRVYAADEIEVYIGGARCVPGWLECVTIERSPPIIREGDGGLYDSTITIDLGSFPITFPTE